MDPVKAVERFYSAFQRRDSASMGACYADDVHFSDPVFPNLRGERARAMWRMLCGRSADLTIEYKVEGPHGDHVHAYWVANYTFKATGRPVENRINATLVVRNGLIVRHIDEFSFWRWSRQALGGPGFVLGWSSMLRNKVRRTAAESLDAFVARDAGTTGGL